MDAERIRTGRPDADGEAQAVIRAGDGPATVESLVRDLRALGVVPGSTLLVHASMRSLGFVSGGAPAVVLALEEALGPEGTLVFPTHSSQLSEPSAWRNPPVPSAWWPVLRATMPAYDAGLTPTLRMGAIVESFRGQRGVLRSAHPTASFAAWGRGAREVVEGHSFAFGLGDSSPLARVHDRDGSVLLLGVGHDRNTSLHLAENRASYLGKQVLRRGAPVLVDGRREWVEYDDLDEDSSDFPAVGAAFEAMPGAVRRGRVARAEAALMRQRDLVAFAVRWMEANRGREGGHSAGGSDAIAR